MKNKSILLIESDENFGTTLKELLERENNTVVWRKDGAQGWEALSHETFDLLLLEANLPEISGLTIVSNLRRSCNYIPAIFISSLTLQSDINAGLRAGADDYILKPFNTEELLLRMEALARRARASYVADAQQGSFMFNGYEFNALNHHLVAPNGGKTKLTKKESALLHLFCVNLNKTVRRELTLTTIWGDNDYFMGRSMDVYIVRVRRLIKNIPGLVLVNVHGQGFRLEYKQLDVLNN